MKRWMKTILTASMLSALLCGSALADGLDVTGDSSVYTNGNDALTITKAGDYTVSGDSSGYILIDLEDTADGAVNLTLNGVNITTTNTYAIKNVDSTLTITLAEDSKNSLVSGSASSESDQYCIWDASDNAMTITGTGEIDLEAESDSGAAYGIYSNTDLNITKATITGIEVTSEKGDAQGIRVNGDILTLNNAKINEITTKADAERSYGIYVGGTRYKDAICMEDSEIGNITIDAYKAGYAIRTNDGNISIIETEIGNITIDSEYSGQNAHGISADLGAITLTDSEIGDIQVSRVYNGVAYCIYSNQGDITIEETEIGNLTVAVTTGSAYTFGIRVNGSDLIITNSEIGNVSATSDSKNASGFYVDSGDITITDAVIGDITAHSSTSKVNGGMHTTKGDITITNTEIGDISVTSGTLGAYGINATGSVTIEEESIIGDITANGVQAFAIFAYGGDAVISDAEIGAISTTSTTSSSYGIYVNSGDTDISNTTIGDITATSTASSAYGIYSAGTLAIDASVLSATGDTYGIRAVGDFSVTDETSIVTAIGGTKALSLTTIAVEEDVLYVWAGDDAANAENIENDEELLTTLEEEAYPYVQISAVEPEDDGPRSTASSRTESEVQTDSSDGGSVSVDKDDAKQYELVTIYTDPDTGYVVGNVSVTDEDGNEIDLIDNGDGTYSLRMPAGGVEIEVNYVLGEAIEDVTGSPFLDLSPDSEAFEAIMALYENGIIYGMSDITFGGDLPITRGMITTMFYRIVSTPDADSAGFSDVTDGQWYTDGVDWAAGEEVVSGYEDGTFRSTQEITNQEMCVILMNFAIYCGAEVDESLSADDVADWSATAVAWAMELGMFEGNATDVVTREQACKMIYAVLEYLADM